jgi:phage terminase small subunit
MLTPKQHRFVKEYLVDLNATQAAIRAGFSAKTAEQAGSRLLRNVKVKAALEQEQASLAERTEITQERVLQELAKIGFADVRRMFTPGGNLLPPTDLNDDMAAAVQSVEVVVRRAPGGEQGEVEHVHKIKLNDKLGALTQIGRHLGMFTDRHEHSGPAGAPITTKPDLSGLTDEQLHALASIRG